MELNLHLASERPVVLITGASRGIGAATALLAAERGYDVAFTYLGDEQTARSVVQQLEAKGARCLALRVDLSSEAEILALFAELDKNFTRLDALVNNAGILRRNLLAEMDASWLQKIFAVNVLGTIICAREAVKRMSTRQGGRGGAIVNVSSIASKYGSPFEYIDYAASKGAVDSFTLGLAKEVAQEGIRVNCVRPGIINTEIHARSGEPGRIARIAPSIPMARAGEPEEIAKAILWLLSEESSYITGSFIDVSGGR